MMMRFQTAVLSIVLVSLPGVPLALADPVVITAPPNGATVPPQVTVKVTYGDVEYCDTGGCSFIPADEVELWADVSALLDKCWPCKGDAAFDVMLTPGPHELTAIACAGSACEWSKPIQVTVEEAATTGDASTGGGTNADGSTSTGANTSTGADASTATDGETDKKDGCACGVGDGPAYGLAWLAIGVLSLRRRR